MEDLDDHMLTRILVRLPSCATVLAYNLVNKRWCSLISDPNFPVQFRNHQMKTTTLLKGSGSDHEDDELPWSFITTKWSGEQEFITETVFGSPKLSLEFLPGNSFCAMATFKDLVLCTSYETHQGRGRVYYITNPLTKQWVALPPSPLNKHRLKRITGTALVCQDFKYRVVQVDDPRINHSLESSGALNLVVYFSEIGKWKEIKLRVSKEFGLAEPEIVVCNGIIYFNSGLCLVGFDPFDVNDTTLEEARVMPPLPGFGCLRESSGQLFVLSTPTRNSIAALLYKVVGMAIELPMVAWRLDVNQAPLVWKTAFQGLCKGTLDIVSGGIIHPNHIVVHPYNHKLIYMYLISEKEFVLCDLQAGCITPLKDLPTCYSSSFHRLENQWWPTSVPACAMQPL